MPQIRRSEPVGGGGGGGGGGGWGRLINAEEVSSEEEAPRISPVMEGIRSIVLLGLILSAELSLCSFFESGGLLLLASPRQLNSTAAANVSVGVAQEFAVETGEEEKKRISALLDGFFLPLQLAIVVWGLCGPPEAEESERDTGTSSFLGPLLPLPPLPRPPSPRLPFFPCFLIPAAELRPSRNPGRSVAAPMEMREERREMVEQERREEEEVEAGGQEECLSCSDVSAVKEEEEETNEMSIKTLLEATPPAPTPAPAPAPSPAPPLQISSPPPLLFSCSISRAGTRRVGALGVFVPHHHGGSQ
eukprot:511444-Hanusia_phi.AAC.1